MIGIEQILALEARSRQQGSGITRSDLSGVWLLVQNWQRDGKDPPPGTGSLLRFVGAQLDLTPQDDALKIANQVGLGSLTLRFEGCAELEGMRPLLKFRFSTMMLNLGARTLLTRELPAPSRSKTPFFALIDVHHDEGCDWLTARGRGGGLALWKKLGTIRP